MLSKISALAFIASVSAAATSLPSSCTGTAPALTCTGFPQFKTATASPTAAIATAQGNQGGYACLRNNFAYVWPVNKDGSFAAVTTPTAPAAGSGIQAFYGTAAAALGTVAAIADAATTAAQNSGCCVNALQACLVANADAATAPYTGVVPTRFVKAAAAGTDFAYTGYVAMHADFVLGATWQSSAATFDAARVATAWCDPMLVTLTANTPRDIVTGQGLSGLNKCTYIIKGPAGQGAPAFSVKSITTLAALTFDLHFAEWKTADVTYVAQSSASPNWLGNYAPSTYPNPIATNTWNSNAAQWTPLTKVPGSVGDITYWSQIANDVNPSRQITVDTGVLVNDWMMINSQWAGYNTALAASNTAVGAYNTAIAAEKTRVGDFFKAIFEAPVKIPARPCPPTQPAAYSGPMIWGNLTGLTAAAGAPQTLEMNAKAGYLSNAVSGQLKSTSGFVQVSTDSAVFNATTLAISGHTFGLYGQGASTMPGTANAFFVGQAAANIATDIGNMMVSIFPNDAAQPAVASGLAITLTARSVAWNNGNYPLNAPAQPAAPAMPVAAMGAQYLVAGLTAATAVAMTLF